MLRRSGGRVRLGEDMTCSPTRISPAELEAYVKNYADTIAGNAPLTVKAAKFIANETVRDESKRNPARCTELVEQCFRSNDYTEGRRAFMEKRKPAFTGT